MNEQLQFSRTFKLDLASDVFFILNACMIKVKHFHVFITSEITALHPDNAFIAFFHQKVRTIFVQALCRVSIYFLN